MMGAIIIWFCLLLFAFCIPFQGFSYGNVFANGQPSLLPVYNTSPITPARRGLAPHSKQNGIKP